MVGDNPKGEDQTPKDLSPERFQELLRQAMFPEDQLQDVLRRAILPEEQLQELFRKGMVPEDQLQDLLRLAVFPEEQLQELFRNVTLRESQLQEAFRRAILQQDQLDEAIRNAALRNEQVQAALRKFVKPSEKLVPETSVDQDDEEPSEPPSGDYELPSALSTLLGILETAGRSSEVKIRQTGDGHREELTFTLQAGRNERDVVVDEEAAAALVRDPNLLSWRSLTSYDGVWNQETAVIEVAVQRPRFSPQPGFLRNTRAESDDDEGPFVEVTEPISGTRLTLGEAHDPVWAILGPGRRYRHRPLTLRCEGHSVATTDEAEALVERLADSFFFDVEVNYGYSMALGRLESSTRPRRWLPARRSEPSFPASQYPHAPVLLYRLGRDRLLPPVIRYWALYQVLEYFFPKYSSEQALRRLARHLRSPSFDPHREEDVLAAIGLVGASANAGERDLLISTLRAITSPEELRAAISELNIAAVLKSEGRGLSQEMVNPESDDVLRLMALRIYDVRCKIVHSKSSGDDLGPGLLAGTAHDDLIQPELPLLEYLAQQALVSSGEPLR